MDRLVLLAGLGEDRGGVFAASGQLESPGCFAIAVGGVEDESGFAFEEPSAAQRSGNRAVRRSATCAFLEDLGHLACEVDVTGVHGEADGEYGALPVSNHVPGAGGLLPQGSAEDVRGGDVPLGGEQLDLGFDQCIGAERWTGSHERGQAFGDVRFGLGEPASVQVDGRLEGGGDNDPGGHADLVAQLGGGFDLGERIIPPAGVDKCDGGGGDAERYEGDGSAPFGGLPRGDRCGDGCVELVELDQAPRQHGAWRQVWTEVDPP